MQFRYANYLKVLCSKSRVLNVQGDFISHDEIRDYQKEFNKASTIRTGWTNLTVKTELNPNITQNPRQYDGIR